MKSITKYAKISSSILRTLLTNGTSETLDSVCHEDVLCKAGRCGQANSCVGAVSGGKSRRGESKS